MPRQRGIGSNIWKFVRKKPLGAFGFALIIFLFAMTLGTPKPEFGWPALPDRPLGFELGDPWMARYDPGTPFRDADGDRVQYSSVTSTNWLGTDGAGRDTYSRIVHGARRSLFIGLWALFMATVLGTLIGVISGYFGKWVDIVSQRLMDALQSFPPLIALILIVTINPLSSGPSLTVAAFALGLVGVPQVQRIVRGVVLATREQQYVEAARVIGASDVRIMRSYILPNIFSSIIVLVSTGLGVVILAEAALSFIVPNSVPQTPSWGLMLNEGSSVAVDEPMLAIASATVIALAVLGFNLAGDALRDVLDPRLRVG